MKLVISILVGVVVITFGFGGLISALDRSKRIDNESLSEVAGIPLSSEDLSAAVQQALVHVEIAMGIDTSERPDIYEKLQEMGLRRLATLSWAESMGIVTGDDEVDLAIKREFRDSSGQYSQQSYEMFLSQVVQKLRIHPSVLREYFRSSITLQKMQSVIAATTWVTPSELYEEMARYTDSFTLEYVTLDAQKLTKKVKVSDEEVGAYFAEHSEMFMDPERVNVRYIAVPISEFVAEVVATEDEALDYYNENIDEYLIVETNDSASVSEDVDEDSDPDEDESEEVEETEEIEVADSFLDIASEEPELVFTPYEEVEEELLAMIVHEKATIEAERKAMDFVINMAPDRYGNAMTFEEAAEDAKLEISTSPFFGLFEDIEGMDVPAEFNAEAFEILEREDDSKFSSAITGEDMVYVLELYERREPALPELASVFDLAEELALATKKNDKLLEAAETTLAELKEEMGGSKTNFAAAAEELDLEPMMTEPFAISAAPTNLFIVGGDLQKVSTRNGGEFCEPIVTEDSVALVYVESRVPSEAAQSQEFRQYIANAIQQERSAVLFRDWQDMIFAEAELEKLLGDGEEEELEEEAIPEEPVATEEEVASAES